MKSTLNRLLSVMTAAVLCFGMTACKSSTKTYYLSDYSDITTTSGDSSNTDVGTSDGTSGDSQTSGSGNATGTSGGTIQSGGVLSGGKQDTSKAKTKEQVIASMPDKLKNTEIHYFYWHDPHERMEAPALEEFEKKTGIKLVSELSSANDFFSELVSRVAAGNSPDMVRCRFTDPYALVGLQPITNTGFDFSDPAWSKDIMSAYTVNGKCYAVNLANTAILDVGVMYYNRKTLKDADMEDPYDLWKAGKWTWSKFWDMCTEFVESKRGREGYYGATFEYTNAYVLSMGSDVISYDSNTGKYTNNLNNSTLVSSWTRTVEAIETKQLYKGHDMNSFETGKILFMFSGPFSARTDDSRQVTMKKRGQLGVVPMPTDSNYQILYETTAFAVPVGAKNGAAVPYLLRWMLDQTSYDMDKVYCDSQAREAVEYAISRGNYTLPHYSRIMDQGETKCEFKVVAAGSKQIKSYFDSISPQLDAAIAAANKRMLTLDGQ